MKENNNLTDQIIAGAIGGIIAGTVLLKIESQSTNFTLYLSLLALIVLLIILLCRPIFNRAIEKRKWENIKKIYRQNICNEWKSSWPTNYSPSPQLEESELCEYLKNLKLEPNHTPYIEDQGLQSLEVEGEKVFRSLDPAAFTQGRDTEQKAEFDRYWVDRERKDFLESLKRVFVVSGGGIGKTTLLKWLEFKLNTGNATTLAFRFDASFFINELFRKPPIKKDSEIIMELLANKLDVPQSEQEKIKFWLDKEQKAGHIVLLIDGFDHSQANIPEWLIKAQSPNNPTWGNCSIILSGRPYVINKDTWASLSPHNQDKMFVDYWKFWRPKEFNKNQQKAYLGVNSNGEFRWNQLPEKARSILSIPRVLEYLREIEADKFAKIDSVTMVYDEALLDLVKKTMNPENVKLQQMGLPKDDRIHNNNGITDTQIKYVLALLGVLAFLMTLDKKNNKWNFDFLGINSVISEATKRIYSCSANTKEISEAAIKEDILQGLAGFSAIANNGVLESSSSPTEMINLFWTNKSVQCYLVAYWLARHADEVDAKTFEQWIWSPESEMHDLYEVNLFLAEMPQKSSHCVSWIRSAAAWFKAEQSLSRPAEMMFRAWPRLLEYASENIDDWWNVSYEEARNRTKEPLASVEVSLMCENASSEEKITATNLAKNVINEFRNQLMGILKSTGDDRSKIAKEFVSELCWKQVREGVFMMGSPEEEQGLSESSKSDWIVRLDRIKNGEKADEVSEELNEKQWFTGFQGKELRELDVAWLSKVFSTFHNEILSNSPDAYDNALKKIEENWYRKDESPLQNPQQVNSFEMHKFPILHQWFWLFSPHHRKAVEGYLNSIETETKSSPREDHPAIYISWFDAWAFCQWAQWENEGKTYRCRLPHEPEWEFAAHGSPNTPRNKFLPAYWWGNNLTTSNLNKKAHLDGNPGETRIPMGMDVEPNGLGFHDILGNVWEWTANIYQEKYSCNFPNSDERKKLSLTESRTMRGGIWYFKERLTRCSNRFRLGPDDRDYKMGFRVIREEIVDSTKKLSGPTIE